jgi:hypothetical protein
MSRPTTPPSPILSDPSVSPHHCEQLLLSMPRTYSAGQSNLFQPYETTECAARGILPAWLDQQLDTPFEAFLRSLHGGDSQRSEDVIRFDRESLNEKIRRRAFGSRLERSLMLFDSLSRRERPLYGFPPTDPCRLYSRRDLNGCPPGRDPTPLAGFSAVKYPGLIQLDTKGLKPVYDLGIESDSRLLGVETGLFRGPKSASSSRNVFVKGTGCNQRCNHHGDSNLDPRALLADSKDSCPTAWMRMEEEGEGVSMTPNMFTECPSCSHGYDPRLPMSCLRNRDELICLMSNLNLRERGYERDTEKIHCFLLSTDCKATSTVSDSEKLLHSSLAGIGLLGCKKQSIFLIPFGPPPFSEWRDATGPSKDHTRNNAAMSEALGTPEQVEAFLFSPVGELERSLYNSSDWRKAHLGRAYSVMCWVDLGIRQDVVRTCHNQG